jgi:hypothetical protein
MATIPLTPTYVFITPDISAAGVYDILEAAPGRTFDDMSEVTSIQVSNSEIATTGGLYMEPCSAWITSSLVGITGELDNNGQFNITGNSTVTLASLAGDGRISVANSNLTVNGAMTGNTISLASSHLYVSSPADLYFLSVNMNAQSSITLEDMSATSEMFWQKTGQLELFDHHLLIANIHVQAGNTVYAEGTTVARHGAMMLSTSPTNHIPITIVR